MFEHRVLCEKWEVPLIKHYVVVHICTEFTTSGFVNGDSYQQTLGDVYNR